MEDLVSVETFVLRLAHSHNSSVYLGTSSNWAFNRRVLNIAHERLTGQPVAADITTYYHKTYDLNWNDPKDKMMLDNTCLPSSDHAIYLINAVKFHCGQIFHLFDESTFMQQFQAFQAGISNPTTSQGLWYIHYLLILAFGKVFVARRRNSGRPPGAELFEKAMDILPNIVVLSANPVESIEILCCMALYLQCLDFRGPAHVVVSSTQSILGRFLTLDLDWSGFEDSYGRWHAYEYARSQIRRDFCATSQECLVDNLHP